MLGNIININAGHGICVSCILILVDFFCVPTIGLSRSACANCPLMDWCVCACVCVCMRVFLYVYTFQSTRLSDWDSTFVFTFPLENTSIASERMKWVFDTSAISDYYHFTVGPKCLHTHPIDLAYESWPLHRDIYRRDSTPHFLTQHERKREKDTASGWEIAQKETHGVYVCIYTPQHVSIHPMCLPMPSVWTAHRHTCVSQYMREWKRSGYVQMRRCWL